MPWTEHKIETDSLRLRPFVDDDKPAIRRLLTDPDVRRYLGGPVDDEHLAALASATVGEQWGRFCIAASDSDRCMGSTTFDRDRGELELSFQLLPEFWGQGIGREATTHAINWAWTSTEDASMIAVTQQANEPSLRLLGGLGFRAESTFEEFGARQVQLRLDRPAVE